MSIFVLTYNISYCNISDVSSYSLLFLSVAVVIAMFMAGAAATGAVEGLGVLSTVSPPWSADGTLPWCDGGGPVLPAAANMRALRLSFVID